MGKCKEYFNLVLTFLKNEESIKTVYLAGYWSYLAAGRFAIVHDNWRLPRPVSPEDSLSFQKNGATLISTLISAKKEVVFIRDVPDFDFDINSCLAPRPFSITTKIIRRPCAIDKAEYEKRMLSYNSSLSELLNKFPNIKVFDPKTTMLCDNKFCWASKNDALLYYNGDHLNTYGADLVVKELLSKYPVK